MIEPLYDSLNMAAIRGFTLDKLTSVRMVFSVFDCRATSTRCAGRLCVYIARHKAVSGVAQGIYASSDSYQSEGDELEMRSHT